MDGDCSEHLIPLPVLVLRFEANSEEALDHIKNKFKQVLEEIEYNFEDF